MIQRLTKAITGSLVALGVMFVPALVLAPSAAAQVPNLETGLCSGAEFTVPTSGGSGTACQPTNINTASFQSTVNNIVNIITFIVGAIAVIMIIYGGFRYITSGGDPGKVTSAKNTILYGLIGLVIVAVAQVLTRFVFTWTSNNF